MIAKEAFLGVRPANKVGYYVIASPVGGYFTGGAKPVLDLAQARTTRAQARAARVRRRPAATTPRASCRRPRRTSRAAIQVVFLDQDRNVEELGGMNVVFVYKDGTIVYSPVDPRGHRDSILQLAADPRAQGRGSRGLDR